MRLSRSRLALRALLLAAGGAYMVVRGVVARRAAGELDGAQALLASRLALVALLVGALALLTAVAAVASLARRPPARTLRLDGLRGQEDGAPRSDRGGGTA